MQDIERHLIDRSATIKEALRKLNDLAADAILFVVDQERHLIGSLTDGDVRRGFLRGLTFESAVESFIQANPKYIQRNNYSIEKIIEYRNKNLKIVPVVDDAQKVVTIINFRQNKSYLPVDAVLMAGGRGERLRPLTDTIPKPLLPIANKPIIDYNLDRLVSFGIDDLWISVRYLGEKIREQVGDGSGRGVRIQYIQEDEPLGTIGAVRKVDSFSHPYVLVSNSDLLTNLDYEDFFIDFQRSDAALSVVTIPYMVNVPYAVLETANGHVVSFKEKPSYTYYSNGGIYLMKREVIQNIPPNTFYNATDFMELLIKQGQKVISYPMRGYWLDIGRPEDYQKASIDINHIKF
ncbi:MAG TPA: nucleotidyltransferase family protein [Chryseolinea sp.]